MGYVVDRNQPDMTDPLTQLVDDVAEHGLVRRIEYVRTRMHNWGLTADDPGHLDVDDTTNLDPEHPRYIRADHPALPAYYARIVAEALDPVKPDDPDELRRRATLDWAATATHVDRGRDERLGDNPNR